MVRLARTSGRFLIDYEAPPPWPPPSTANSAKPQADPPPAGKGTGERRKKTPPQQVRALRAILALFGKVPDQAAVPDSSLCEAVREWLKEEAKQLKVPFQKISDKSILRAAGRKT
jgi:hypothetical protein